MAEQDQCYLSWKIWRRIDTIDVAQENQVELLCLPPNSTHMLQPLDVAVFHKFKGEYSKIVN